MFGDACKGSILLFFSLQGNGAAGSDSRGAGSAGPSLRRNRRGTRMAGAAVSYSETSKTDSDQSLWDVAAALRKRPSATVCVTPSASYRCTPARPVFAGGYDLAPQDGGINGP